MFSAVSKYECLVVSVRPRVVILRRVGQTFEFGGWRVDVQFTDEKVVLGIHVVASSYFVLSRA